MNLLGMVPPHGTGLHRRNRLCDGCCVAWGFSRGVALGVQQRQRVGLFVCFELHEQLWQQRPEQRSFARRAFRVGRSFGKVQRRSKDQSLANLQDKVQKHFSGIDDNDICLDKAFSHQRRDDVTCPGKLFFFGLNTIRRGYLD